MRKRLVSFACLVYAVSIFSIARHSVAQSAESSEYKSESLVIESAETTYRYNEDGTGEKQSVLRLRFQSEAGVNQYSVLSVPYAAATEEPKIEKLVVRHTDGSTMETPSSDAIEMPAPISQQAPLYSDLKILQVPVRGLRVGDTLEYRIRVVRKNPEAPGQFWERFRFSRSFVVLSEVLTLDVPSGKFVQQWTAGAKPQVSESGGRTVYSWRNAQLKPTPSGNKKDENDPDSHDPGSADVAWTTFRSWAEVGDWYRSLAASRAIPTDVVRAQADEITRDAKTVDEQVQALYTFVSTRIRYVGIDFGVGRYQPHTAAEVLATRYGDCKDKDTLFEAFLRAKGIATSPALIGVNVDLVETLPSPGFFNHVITTINLAGGRLWADTTPGVTPFQMLISLLRDKQALVIPEEGNPILVHTPADTPFAFKNEFESESTLNKDGELTGKVKMSFRSDSEVLVRAVALNLAAAQWDRGAQLIAVSLGFSGTVSNSVFENAGDLKNPIQLQYEYTKKPFGDWDNLRIVPLIPVLSLPEVPDKLPAKDIELGAVRTETVNSRIHVPSGFNADLPDAVHVKSDFFTLDKTYKFADGILIVDRKLVVAKSKIPASSWELYKGLAKKAAIDGEPWIQLVSTSAASSGSHIAGAGADAAALIRQANALERSQNWDAAREKLDLAKSTNPDQAFLWSNYGYIAMMQRRNDEADADFRRELASHPEETYVVTLYAGFLMRHSRPKEAISVLQNSFDRDPTEPDVAEMLASVQSLSNVDDGILTLRKALDAHAADPKLEIQLASLLLRKGDKAGAAGMMSKMIDRERDDANLLNDAAYLIADADGNLDAAEKASRKSLDILEGQTERASISTADQSSFAQTALLVASWDTLGYILLKEKKTAEALEYMSAAWKNSPRPLIGLHYGATLEDANKLQEALRIYSISASMVHGNVESDRVWQLIQERIAKLKAQGLSSTRAGESDLQVERTFKLNLPTPCRSYQSNTIRLQFAWVGALDATAVGGKPESESTIDTILHLKFPHMVPSGSKGRILRDGVFTCSAHQSTAYFVLFPLGGIEAEQNSK